MSQHILEGVADPDHDIPVLQKLTHVGENISGLHDVLKPLRVWQSHDSDSQTLSDLRADDRNTS